MAHLCYQEYLEQILQMYYFEITGKSEIQSTLFFPWNQCLFRYKPLANGDCRKNSMTWKLTLLRPKFEKSFADYKDEEYQFLNVIEHMLKYGECFEPELTFTLTNNTFPLITTKKMHWQHVASNLLYTLKRNAARINQANSGSQWQHYYNEQESDFKEFEQLADCIQQIKQDTKTNQFVSIAGSNPLNIPEKFITISENEFVEFHLAHQTISCTLQRSTAMLKDIPNIVAFYAMFTYLIGHICKLKTGELTLKIGVVKMQQNEQNMFRQQIKTKPYRMPQFTIKNNYILKPHQFQITDFKMYGYESWPKK